MDQLRESSLYSYMIRLPHQAGMVNRIKTRFSIESGYVDRQSGIFVVVVVVVVVVCVCVCVCVL